MGVTSGMRINGEQRRRQRPRQEQQQYQHHQQRRRLGLSGAGEQKRGGHQHDGTAVLVPAAAHAGAAGELGFGRCMHACIMHTT
jgi:hypothetical protein